MQPSKDLLRDTTARYAERSERRSRTLRVIEEQGVLAANDPELVAQRLDRLHTDRQLVEQLKDMSRSFSPTGPGVAPRDFPRSLERGMQVARAVARVQIRDGQGRAAGYGIRHRLSDFAPAVSHQQPRAGHGSQRRCQPGRVQLPGKRRRGG
jgi:hypothetical protein